MEDNFIGKELDQDELDIIKKYQDDGKLHPDWFPLTTYDMVQCGYPRPDHGEMIAMDWGGTDGEGRLLPADGMWCKVEDVKKYLENIMSLVTGNQTGSEEKILTIKKVNIIGKWIEFWFEEEFPTITGAPDAYQLSSKEYMLWDAVNRAEFERPIMLDGFVGKKLKWKKEGFNWEIVDFV